MKWIVITGAESSGKSTLTHQLAQVFDGIGILEYARDYIERLRRPYQRSDVETIAKRQFYYACKIRQVHANRDVHIFLDTFLIVTKIWFEEVYHCCPVWLNQAIIDNKPNLVLLCEPDLEWQADGVRENSNKRSYLYNRYRKELEFYQIPFSIVNGMGDKRLQTAIHSVNEII
jgi:nicotinamide riboside kinase